MNNLVVVAHPDDEVIGFGGTGAMLAKKGELVKVVILCGSVQKRNQRPSDASLFKDATDANASLGFAKPTLGPFPNLNLNNVEHHELVSFIEKQIEDVRPQRIFTHHPSDLNDDHRFVSHACLTASRINLRKSTPELHADVFLMEILSSTDWSYCAEMNQFLPNTYVDITETFNAKLEALSCYAGVMRPPPHSRSKENLEALAVYRGGQCGQLRAESFQQVHRLGL
jgi:LmbE family N-acetylglucosaminyl deacetylase